MASQFDDSDFIDRDFQSAEAAGSAAPGHDGGAVRFRPPSREELDGRVSQAQLKLAELKRAQEELERERAALEEARRRRLELQTGRAEILENLNRGLALLEQAEFSARRDAEQMAKTLGALRDSLAGVQSIREETWTQENWNSELTKALASIENARMEWNQARLKWTLLNGPTVESSQQDRPGALINKWRELPFREACKLGVALTWPVALVGWVGLLLWLILRAR
jgi:hypothetical protein